MSTSKKPGTDLAALKARLAKKTKGKAADVPAAPEQPAAPQAQAPPEPMPAPAAPVEQAAPQPVYEPPPRDVPPPGHVAPQPVHEPAPMQQPPAPDPMAMGQAAPAIAPAAASDDPFGGGAGSFDPSEGLLDAGGEVKSKSSIGLLIFAAILGAGFGSVAGFLGQKMVDNKERKAKGTAKGEAMVKAVDGIISARQDVSLKMEALEKKMATDPKGAATEIETLLSEKWEEQVKVSQLFGWQLAAVHPTGVKRTFELFEEASRVKKDLQYLQAFLASQPEALLKGSGPSQFAVVFQGGKGKLVAALEPLCAGETPETPPKTCADADRGKAVAFRVIDKIGGEPKIIPRGNGDGQALLLSADGGVYAYAVGMEPSRNAVIYRTGLVKRINDHLEAMAKVEKSAKKALEKYAQDPDVDGSVEQPDPEAGGGEGG